MERLALGRSRHGTARHAPLSAQFASEFPARLHEAYHDRGHGVVLPFRRVFAVGRRPD